MSPLFEAFTGDLEKYFRIDIGEKKSGLFRKLIFIANNFGLQCVAAYRFGQVACRLFSGNFFVGFIPKLLHLCINFLIRLIFHVDIIVDSIGPGFYIGHIGTIYIGAKNIGKNFSVSHNVTIGIGYSEGKVGRPVIGDNVWIGTGSTVVGAISIGNNVTIMPGSFLSRDIPDGCLVGGNPARILSQKYDNQTLFRTYSEKQNVCIDKDDACKHSNP